MLEFNPFFRPTAKELLKNKIFTENRMPQVEEGCSHRIKIDIDVDCTDVYEDDYVETPKLKE